MKSLQQRIEEQAAGVVLMNFRYYVNLGLREELIELRVRVSFRVVDVAVRVSKQLLGLLALL